METFASLTMEQVLCKMTRFRFMLIVLQMLWCWRIQLILLHTNQEDLQSPTYLACPLQGSPFLLP